MNFESSFAESVFNSKYLIEGETLSSEAEDRIIKSVSKIYPEIEHEARNYISKHWFIPAGGVWRAAGNPKKNVSHINCTTLGDLEDNLESIFDKVYKWAKYAAFGQGEGIDISNLRPRGAKVHNSSRSSTGAVSFMQIFDSVLKVIAQQGRRGASLISIKDHHPDVEEFISVKDKPDSDKSRIDTANISIQTSDAFMQAVIDDADWILWFENKYERIERTVKARDLFNKICEMAWKRGDPGLQFIDNSRRESNSDALGYNILSTNACCFTGDTLITTKVGILPIKDLVGKEVEIFDGENWVKNSMFKSYGEDEIYRVHLNSGVYFDVTKNHRFFLQDGSIKQTYKLTYGDKLEIISKELYEKLYSSEEKDTKLFINSDYNKVISVEKLNKKEEVFCTTVPTTSKFLINSGIITGNSEQWLDRENVCNLSHINLAKFHEYGIEGYIKLIKFGVKFLNAIRINEYEEDRSPTSLQKEKIKNVPRIGLGVTGFADYLIDKKIRYDSELAINEMRELLTLLAKHSYKTGYELGKKYGSFPTYNKENFKKSEYIQRLLNEGVIEDSDLDYQFNVCYTTIAPVGTGSIIANVGGSGIEPLFSKYYVRRERSTTNDWKEWFTFNAYVERYLKEHGLEVTKENADKLTDDYWVMSYDVDNYQKIKLVAEAQKWIDSSISVTFNLPEDCTVNDVKDIYTEAWKHGLKGITVYREGSLVGVLITEKNYDKSRKEAEVKAKEKYKGDNYVKRPDELPCDIHEAKYKDDKFIVLIGLNNGEPYEVFVTPNNNNEVDVEKYKKGIIKKVKSNHYNLIVENGVTKTMVNNIGKSFDSLYGTLSRMVSMSLRHGVSLHFIVDQLNKDSGFVAFEKVLSRILKKYIKDGTKASTKDVCPVCNENLIFVNGCKSCPKGCWSKCE